MLSLADRPSQRSFVRYIGAKLIGFFFFFGSEGEDKNVSY